MTGDLWRLDVTELARLIRLGRASSREATESCLGRLLAVNPGISAVVHVLEEQALEAADAADREALGPLHDVPVTVKVNTEQADCATDNGVVAFRNAIATEDAPVVANLRRAGAVIIGRTNSGFTHPAQAEAVRQAGRHLAAAGYAVDEVAPPDLEEIIETWHRIGSTDVAGALAPRMEEFGDADARTSMRHWLERCPPTGLQGLLAAFAQRDLLLWRWLTFMQRYPLVVMPTLGDMAPPHNLDTTREGQARVLDSLRVSLISPLLGIPALAVPVGNHGRLRPGVQILAPRFREDLCLDAGKVIEAAEGVVTPIDPVPLPAAA